MATTRMTGITMRLGRVAASLVGLGAALAIGCGGAPPDDAEVSASAVGSAVLPEAMCSLVSGVDTSGLSGGSTMRVGGGYSGPDASVMQFQQAIGAIGGVGRYTISRGVGVGSVSWYAIDVTHVDRSAVTGVVGQYPGAPVSAGLYSCTYNWGDYVLPVGGKHPYTPKYVVAYDPRGCSSCM
jgi:hypothetical protein